MGVPCVIRIETELGVFGAAFSQQGLCRLTFPSEPIEKCYKSIEQAHPGPRDQALSSEALDFASQLARYCTGNLEHFEVRLDMDGTGFQKQVWNALLCIPYGETRTYGQIAAQIGKPTAVRAIGNANHANPIPIVVPCHRVIGSNGSLVGFGGGLDLKRRLLDLETSRRSQTKAI